MIKLSIQSAALACVLAAGAPLAQAQASQHVEGKSASGSSYVMDVPAAWNGTVLLFAHGYGRGPANPARNVARDEKDWLLARGYALVGSSYARTGWAVEEAVPDQLAALDAFSARFGKPKTTIAWGSSMGGLVTIALAERHPERIDGALALCASAAGTVGMMNSALDGAFVFRSLAAPASQLPLLFDASGERAKADMAAWQQQLDLAQATPAGRARIALAATVAQVPAWIDAGSAQPAPDDIAGQQKQLYRGLLGATLMPRDDQQLRAGGNFSWNTGIDYGAQLERSGRASFVRALYREAGLDLDKDLAVLAGAPRMAAQPQAVAYMKQHYAPTGKLARPLMLIQTVADPVTLVEMSGDYAGMAAAAGRADQVRAAYVQRVGHCTFDRAETIAGLQAVEARIAKGQWTEGAAAMNALAGSLAAGPSSFVDYKPALFLRRCAGGQECAGEQAGARISAPGRYSGYAEQAYPDYMVSSRYVAASDGTRLAVDLYRPAAGGKATDDKLPVLLMHTTGVRRDPDPVGHAARLAQYGIPSLVRSGYVVAWMEPRGVGASFGASNGFVTPRMGQDVGSVVEWLAVQPWSTGKVGMIGSSNGGLIQMAAAAAAPPHLVAIAPGVANPNFYYQLYPNGASAVAGAGSPAARTARAPAPGTPVDEDAEPGHPLLAAATAEHKGGIGMADEWPANMFRDTPNPLVAYAPGLAAAPVEASARISATGVPMYQMAGWFDSSPGGQLAAWKTWGGKVVVGAWVHGLLQPTQGGPMLNIEYRRWYDRLLKGIDNGILDEPPVYYQTIHAPEGDNWRFAADWPLAAQRITPFYFTPGGKLASGKAPAAASEDRYQVDYSIAAFDGKFNRLERVWNGDMSAGVDAKGLSYTTAPLKEDQEITGHPVAHLWVRSSAPDGNFILYLEEVDGDGKSRFVTDGVVRAGHRATTAQSPWRELGVPYHRSLAADFALLPSDLPVELAFDFNPTSYVFRKGSRIRITVTGAEKNTYQLPPGAEGQPAPVIQLHLGGAQASHVTLPLIPARTARFKGQAHVATAGYRYDGAAEFYPSASRNFLKLGERWIRCDVANAICTSAIGQLKVELAGTRVKVTGRGVRFEGTGF